MGIEISKPAPLKIGTTYYYTLSSYDPVAITVTVPQVTDADVDFTLEGILQEKGQTLDTVTDAWVAENIEGVKTLAQAKDVMRAQLEHMNSDYAEQSKPGLCSTELAKRLVQAVPAEEIARFKDQLEQSMAYDAMSQGIALDDYLAQMGISRAQFDGLLSERAKEGVEQQAALSAYASEKKLKIDDSEIPTFLQIPQDQADELIKQAKAAGQLDMLRQECLNMKAANVVTSECSCTYVRETEDDAMTRAQQYEAVLAMQKAALEHQHEDGNDDKPEFKLV
jgi:FKBP-type peptidyl-prolyl cis-trans isomerase (trigger factor)